MTVTIVIKRALLTSNLSDFYNSVVTEENREHLFLRKNQLRGWMIWWNVVIRALLLASEVPLPKVPIYFQV